MHGHPFNLCYFDMRLVWCIGFSTQNLTIHHYKDVVKQIEATQESYKNNGNNVNITGNHKLILTTMMMIWYHFRFYLVYPRHVELVSSIVQYRGVDDGRGCGWGSGRGSGRGSGSCGNNVMLYYSVNGRPALRIYWGCSWNKMKCCWLKLNFWK